MTEHFDIVRDIARQNSSTSPFLHYDDIYSEALLQLVLAYESFDGRGSIKGYIKQRIQRRIKDYYRKILKNHRRDILANGKYGPDIVEYVDHAVPATQDAEVDHILRMRRLPELERLVLTAHMNGSFLREIGDEHGYSGVWAFTLLKEARRKYLLN